MTVQRTIKHAAMAGLGSAALMALAACDSDRTAEAETPVSEAEVSTEMPESAVSDEQLEATANAAADIAATPPSELAPAPQGAGTMTNAN